MGKFKEKCVRRNSLWYDNIFLVMIVAYFMMMGGTILSIILPLGLITDLFTDNEAISDFLKMYLEFIGIWVVTIVPLAFIKDYRPMFQRFWPKKKIKIPLGLLVGGLLGFGMNGLCALGAYLMGDLKLEFNYIDVKVLIGFVIFIFIQSGAEEVVSRWFIYDSLRRRYKNPLFAIIGNALFFMALHLGNSGVTLLSIVDLVLWGVLFALIIYYYDNIWAAIACHTAWNFTQNITLGLPNSGMPPEYSIYKIVHSQNGFFYDTGFGIEGGWGAVVIGLIVCAVMIAINKKTEKNDIWKDFVPEHIKRKIDKKRAEALAASAAAAVSSEEEN